LLYAYVPRASTVERVDLTDAAGDPPANVVWFDLFEPTPAEVRRVESLLGLALPTREEMQEIEPSSRLYVENGASYMTATVLHHADDPNPRHDPITFVLTRHNLVTMRHVDPRPIATFAQRYARQPGTCTSGEDALIALLDAFVDRIADILEKVGADLDRLSQKVFRAGAEPVGTGEPIDMQRVLRELSRYDDLCSTSRESLISLGRVVRFLGAILEAGPKTREHKAALKSMSRDMATLAEHATFESQKVSFLLNGTLGLINIEQNRIIKLFSVAAVVFLPPTLVASIYGMNFDVMPELKWSFGYPMAIALMILSAVVPYRFFKRKGWF
jgi:magnesium transporter